MQERLPSVRNLVDMDIGPLRRFKGILDSTPTKPEKYGDRDVNTMIANFRDIEVVQAIEPYHFPVFSLRSMSISNRKKSVYGIFGESLAKILDMQYSEAQLDSNSPEYVSVANRMDLKDCIGKRLGLVLADGENGRPVMPMLWDMRANEGAGGDVPRACWMVYEVEGIGVAGGGGITALERAMQMLDGKSLAQFNALALEDIQIRANIDLFQSISMPPAAASNFGATMLASGQFTKDGQEVFHRV